MKQLITILLFSATLLQPLQTFWVKVSFELNKNFIAKNLCENRFKPELKCGGKCYLMKKLAEKQKQEKETQKERIETLVFTLFSEKLPSFSFKQDFQEIQSCFPVVEIPFALQECLLSTFRPPCV
ncbi:MAG: hypothetical protein RMJ97_01605 [Raineya sp.]|nr:hypothetical protein [Raineya sp.]